MILKKTLTVCLLLCLLLIVMIMPAYAAVDEPDADVMALYHHDANAKIDISSDGNAEATGKIVGIIGTTTKTTVHLYLQQYKGDKWVDVDDWLSSGETVNRTLVKQKSVEKGYKYRAKASCYAYAGTKDEHVTKYSEEVRY